MDIKLVMFKPDGQRKDIPLTNAQTIVGRGEKCELRVPLLSVSRRHCELSIDGEFLQVKDLGSSNGTYVNNKRVNEADLQPGDRLAIGPVVFTVQIDGLPAQISPVEGTQDMEQAAATESDDMIELETDTGSADEEALKTEVSLATDIAEDDDVLSGILDDDEEMDPIAALEALAAEKEKDEEKKEAPPPAPPRPRVG